MKNTEEMKHFQTAAPATLSTCPWQEEKQNELLNAWRTHFTG
jgi:hypothetical protein